MARPATAQSFNLDQGGRLIRATSDPSAGIVAPTSSIALRDNSGVGEFWLKYGAGNTDWRDLSTGGVAGPSSSTDGAIALWDGTGADLLKDGPILSLDSSYDGGRTITVDAGAVVLSGNAADDNNVLEVNKSPTGSQAGDGIHVTIGANATGSAIGIDHSGGGAAIDIASGPTVGLRTRGASVDLGPGGDNKARIVGIGGNTVQIYGNNALVVEFLASRAEFKKTVRVNDNIPVILGTGSDTLLVYGTTQTPDALVLELSADSRNFIITDKGHSSTDYAHGLSPNPTYYWQAADFSDITKWGSITRTDDEFILGVGPGGTGDLRLAPAGRVFVAADIAGDRGWMVDLSGDSVVGVSGEHVYSPSDDRLNFWVGTKAMLWLIDDAALGVRCKSTISPDGTGNQDLGHGSYPWRDLRLRRSAIGTAQTVQVYIDNNTAAADGAQQFSGVVEIRGRGWKADSPTGSKTVAFGLQTQPVQTATSPTGDLVILSSIDGAAYTTTHTFRSSGDFVLNQGSKIIFDTDEDTYWLSTGDDGVDMFVGNARTWRYRSTFSTCYKTLIAGTDVDIGTSADAFRSGYFDTSVTGTRGWMVDLSGDSVVGVSGEHIYSNVDNTVLFYAADDDKLVLFAGGIQARDDFQILDNYRVVFGGSVADSWFAQSTYQTVDALMLGVATQSRYIILCENTDYAVDFGHTLQTNPTAYWQSSDATDITEWLSVSYGVIATGKGDLTLSPFGDINVGTNTLTGTRGWMLDLSGDSVASTSGEHIISEADTEIQVYTDGFKRVTFDTQILFHSSVKMLSSLSMPDAAGLVIGSGGASADGMIIHNTAATPDTMSIAVGAESNAVTFVAAPNWFHQYNHVQQATPTLFVHSNTAHGTATDEWISFAYGTIATGKGDLSLSPFGGVHITTDLEIDGALNHDGTTVGFFTATPITKPDVSGSKAGNAALADLCTELANLGLITDSTT